MTKKIFRLAAVVALAGCAAGCFQPLYGDKAVVATAGLDSRLSGVDVQPIVTPNGTPVARIGVNVRNELLYDLTGGGNPTAPTHRLIITLATSNQQLIVDINTARPEIQNFGIDASYSLIDVATGKTVITGQTFSRVSYDIPGQQQRFAGTRGRRDAENRAAKVIADNIKSRLASYFVAGT
jgi:LPS-assembly lipoprotein